jgi:TRAP-type C4-dicarboxylate transport system substrate-binding protein
MLRQSAAALAILSLAVAAHADPITLRVATAAPEGTAWAREAHGFARSIETETHGDIHVKWYMGSVAGDERVAYERLKRGQLDALVVGPLCAHLSPAMRVFAAPGLLPRREDAHALMNQARASVDAELAKQGLVNLGPILLGAHHIFSRTPIHSLDQLKRTRLWVWDEEDADRLAFSEMGFTLMPLPVWDAFKAYEQGRIDGFITTPTAMLAFQWNSQARYVLDLTVSWFAGCAFVSQRAFDAMTNVQKETLRAAAARFIVRIEEIGGLTDDELMGSVFERNGLRRVIPAVPMRAAFGTAARVAVERLGPKLIPPDLAERARPR